MTSHCIRRRPSSRGRRRSWTASPPRHRPARPPTWAFDVGRGGRDGVRENRGLLRMSIFMSTAVITFSSMQYVSPTDEFKGFSKRQQSVTAFGGGHPRAVGGAPGRPSPGASPRGRRLGGTFDVGRGGRDGVREATGAGFHPQRARIKSSACNMSRITDELIVFSRHPVSSVPASASGQGPRALMKSSHVHPRAKWTARTVT